MISTLAKLNIDQEETEESELEIIDINAVTLEELEPEEEELDLNEMMLEIQNLSKVHHMWGTYITACHSGWISRKKCNYSYQ